MKSLSSVGLGLSVVFGCLFFALVGEIYYLLWWKRRITGRQLHDDYSKPAGELFYMFCWKKRSRKGPSSLRSTTLNCQELSITADNQGHQSENGFQFHKPFDENDVETGLIVGPPRFLYTITEETKEDLESENGKSKGETRKLSDLMRNGDTQTPYMTPLSSPAFFTSPLTPSMGSSHSRCSSSSINGYNPFYESCTDVEFSKMRSSPPPKFKFLRDAEEKLQRKNTMAESQKGTSIALCSAITTA